MSRTTSQQDTPGIGAPARDWIRLPKYCEITGDTADAVHARRRKRQWLDGKQCIIGPDGNLWICREEVNRWVESNLQPSAS